MRAFVDLAFRIALVAAYRILLVYWLVFRPRTRGAYVFVWCDARLLVIRQSYRRGWTVPAGRVKAGESPIEAAVRELYEETGIRTTPGALAPIGVLPNTLEFKRDEIHAFALRLEREPEVRIDRREVVEARFAAADLLERLDLWPPTRQLLRSPASRPHPPGAAPVPDGA